MPPAPSVGTSPPHRDRSSTVIHMGDRDPSAAGERRSEGQPIRIVLADDHDVVRSGLRLLLEAEGDLEVVAEASDTAAAARCVRGHHPDVLVLDLNMPGEASLHAIPKIRRESPGTEIVVLTMQADPAFAREALGAGALAYVLKAAAGGELVEAVHRAAAGESYLNPALGARIASEPVGPPDDLTAREVDVLTLIAQGHTNTAIGEKLFLSVRTVETHRAHIQQKLLLSTRAELFAYAQENGLLTA
jgi:two-component system, NarL family, response regulator NreC